MGMEQKGQQEKMWYEIRTGDESGSQRYVEGLVDNVTGEALE